MPFETVIGWDLGGAHLKAALAERPGRLSDVLQLPCPLWQGLEKLDQAVEQVLRSWTADARHAITMTGELADLFPDRATGVKTLVERMVERLPGKPIAVFAGRAGFIPAANAAEQVNLVASANWLASVHYLALYLDQALFLDVGSTTTDIIPVIGGGISTESETDADRLSRDELVYTGIVRTPVCAITDRVPFRGEWQTLAAEFFSNMADVYRLLGTLPAGADQTDTPDGRGKAQIDSAGRLARMLGRDAEESELAEWRQLAAHIARRQLARIQDAVDRILSRNLLDETAPLVGAGVGRFLVRRLAEVMERSYVDFGSVGGIPAELTDAAADCAPATALALLAGQADVGG